MKISVNQLNMVTLAISKKTLIACELLVILLRTNELFTITMDLSMALNNKENTITTFLQGRCLSTNIMVNRFAG
ncbi:hypothetical protein DERF_010557 [Dermatophagoides farinae]|uniref:Uncharacterized protein n=1 Tax=Dermatophagoides farinae TaxID=6954 RepID=A0A922HXH7_DERFA|nr:hypothetical protein DERF_010557 [Dermatophagoides farinae]